MPGGRDVKNQTLLVSQMPTSAANTSPPTSGSVQPGRPCTRTASTFTVKAP